MSDAKIGIEAEIAALAKLSPLEYQQQRKDVATRLGVGRAFLDKLVQAKQKAEQPSGQGQPIKLIEHEPCQEPVDGTQLLDAIADLILRHVVMSRDEANAVAPPHRWLRHTKASDIGASNRAADNCPVSMFAPMAATSSGGQPHAFGCSGMRRLRRVLILGVDHHCHHSKPGLSAPARAGFIHLSALRALFRGRMGVSFQGGRATA